MRIRLRVAASKSFIKSIDAIFRSLSYSATNILILKTFLTMKACCIATFAFPVSSIYKSTEDLMVSILFQSQTVWLIMVDLKTILKVPNSYKLRQYRCRPKDHVVFLCISCSFFFDSCHVFITFEDEVWVTMSIKMHKFSNTFSERSALQASSSGSLKSNDSSVNVRFESRKH